MSRTVILTCDRCKKEFHENECFFGAVAEQRIFTIFSNIEMTFVKGNYELCPDCLEKLEAFLNMENENNERS